MTDDEVHALYLLERRESRRAIENQATPRRQTFDERDGRAEWDVAAIARVTEGGA